MLSGNVEVTTTHMQFCKQTAQHKKTFAGHILSGNNETSALVKRQKVDQTEFCWMSQSKAVCIGTRR